MLFKNLQQGNKVNKWRDELRLGDSPPPEPGENWQAEAASGAMFLFSLNLLSALAASQQILVCGYEYVKLRGETYLLTGCCFIDACE